MAPWSATFNSRTVFDDPRSLVIRTGVRNLKYRA
jgi:hypothetical protein